MARSLWKEKWPAKLECNNCEYPFEDLVWVVLVETEREGFGDPVLDKDPTRGVICPNCGQEMARVERLLEG